jgi:hypothetical protein
VALTLAAPQRDPSPMGAEMRKEGAMQRWRWLGLWLVLLSAVGLILGAGQAAALNVGDKAPEFSLPATTAEKISLSDFLGKKPVVVFFYIGAFTRT